MLLLALPVGMTIGLSMGMLGAGGSMLTVPALVFLFGQTMTQATTTSLVIVGTTALTGAVAHWRAGNVRLGTGTAFGLLGAIGSLLGSVASAASDPDLVLLGFAALTGAAAVTMLLKLRRAEAQPSRETAPVHRVNLPSPPVGLVRITAAATAVGVLTGFFGVGGGFIVVPVLVLALRYDTATALGTSLVVILINSSVALLPRLSSNAHAQNWPLLTAFLVAAVMGSFVGTGLATRIAATKLTAVFATMLLALASGSAWLSLGHLL